LTPAEASAEIHLRLLAREDATLFSRQLRPVLLPTAIFRAEEMRSWQPAAAQHAGWFIVPRTYAIGTDDEVTIRAVCRIVTEWVAA